MFEKFKYHAICQINKRNKTLKILKAWENDFMIILKNRKIYINSKKSLFHSIKKFLKGYPEEEVNNIINQVKEKL